MKSIRSHSRRHLLGLALATACSIASAQEAPVHMLVGFAPGGITDVVARVLAQGMGAETGRTVVVENRAGAGGQIAAQVLKGARADGTTIYLTNSHTTAMIPLTTLNPGYDVAKDFVPVGMVATTPNFFIVNPDVVGAGVTDMKSFIEWVKAHPGTGNIGVPAPASTPEFSVSALSKAFGVDLRPVAYRGDAPEVQDMVSGQLAAGICSIAAAAPYVKTGKLKLLAVDGVQRIAPFTDVPTYSELGLKGLDDVIFLGVIAPAGTPADVVAKYNAAINKVVRSKAFADRVLELGVVPKGGKPEDLWTLTEASRVSNAALLATANYKPQ